MAALIFRAARASNLDNSLRQLAAILADWNTGAEAVADTATFGDPADPTKRIRFDAGSITTATTRVMTMPDVDITWGAYGPTLVNTADAAAVRTLLNVENGATADQTGAEIKTAYEGEADTNAFTDDEKTKLSNARETLTGNRTYHVATTGSDSNDGLSSGAPFATLQKATDTVWDTLDLYGNTVTIDVADGTYTAGVSISGRLTGKGNVIFQGDTSTPGNVVISTSGDCFNVQGRAALTLEGLKLTSSGGDAIHCEGGVVNVREADFGTVGFRHIDCRRFGQVFLDEDYTISGGGRNHFYAVENGMIICPNRTINIVGTLNFSSVFAYATDLSLLRATNLTFTGDAANTTGKEYNILANSLCNIGGASESGYFPGDSAGSTSTGGLI